MKRVNIALIILAALFTASCTDFDNNLTEAEIRYNQNFIDQFGNIDPNQDWNMARQVTANLDLSGIRGKATVKIFEADPLATVNAKYLSYIDVTNGVANWKFDAPKSAKELFVHVMQNGVRLYGGYCNVEQGTMSISEGSLHKKTSAKATRAMGTGVGELLWTELCFEPTKNSDGVLIDRNYYQNCVRQIKIESDGFIYYSPDITSTPFRKLAYNNDAMDGYYLDHVKDIKYADGEEVAIANFALMDFVKYEDGKYQFKDDVPYSHQSHISKVYAINETALPTLTDDTRWLIGDCQDLFWTGDAPFAEGVDYRSDNHKTLYAKHGTSVEEIEKEGVIFTTSKDDAEIEIPMMYGATVQYNILGYYYYDPNTQDPRDVNRYVLFSDARPETNIKVDDVAVTGMQLQQKDSKWKDESVVTCKTRKLMYFGLNGELAGTTKFPENLKIGFFIHRHANTYNTGAATLPGDGGWAFSDPTLNYQHIYDAEGPNLTAQGTNWTYRGSRSVSGINSDTGKGNVKAITWNYGGRVLVGFGDDTGDCDLNDFVFWVNGDIKEKPKVNIETKDKDDVYEWIVACEDLGSTDDYDFNDVVFGIRNYKHVTTLYTSFYAEDGQLVTKVPQIVDKKNYLVVTPYAAGGVLKSNIFYYEGGLLGNERDLGEIHSLLNLSEKATYDATASGKMPMLNTTSRTYNGHPVVIQLADDADFSITATKGTTNISNFKVKVTSANGDLANATEATVIKAPDPGTVPQMLVVPCGWDWPTERTDIKDAYPGFTDWVSDATLATWNSYKSGSVISNPYKPSANDNDDNDDDGVDLTIYGSAIPSDKIITDGKNQMYYSKDLFANYQTATMTFVVSSVTQNSQCYINIYKNNQWFTNFSEAPELKDLVNDETITQITKPGVYQLSLSAANLTELADFYGIIFQNMEIANAVISGTEKNPETPGGDTREELTTGDHPMVGVDYNGKDAYNNDVSGVKIDLSGYKLSSNTHKVKLTLVIKSKPNSGARYPLYLLSGEYINDPVPSYYSESLTATVLYDNAVAKKMINGGGFILNGLSSDNVESITLTIEE